MNPVRKQKTEQLNIIGISVRTINANGQAQKDIGELWQRFYKENIGGIIKDKITEDIYCVYTDYESDQNGPYTAIVGYAVKDQSELPNGLTMKIIAAGNYEVYSTNGDVPGSIMANWQYIWANEKNRKYTSDFDIMYAKPQNPDVKGETFLAVE